MCIRDSGNTFPRSSASPRDGSSWVAIPGRRTKSPYIASGLTNFCSPRAKSPMPTTGAFCGRPHLHCCRHRSGGILHSTTPSKPWWECRGTRQSATASGSAHAPEENFACRLRPSGSARLAEAMKMQAHYFRGAMRLRSRCPATTLVALVDGIRGPSLSASANRTDTLSTTCATTCTSGAAIGTLPIAMRCRPSAIHAALKPASGALPAEGRGVTTSRCRAARRAPAFLRSSSMRTMVSVSLATPPRQS